MVSPPRTVFSRASLSDRVPEAPPGHPLPSPEVSRYDAQKALRFGLRRPSERETRLPGVRRDAAITISIPTATGEDFFGHLKEAAAAEGRRRRLF